MKPLPLIAALALSSLSPSLAPADVAVPSSGPAPLQLPPLAVPAIVEQDGKPLPIVDGAVHLRRAPFVLRFDLPVPGGVFLHAWTEDRYLRHVREGKTLEALLPLEGAGMAESPLNPDHELLLATDGYSYWYHETKADTRFDRTERRDAQVIARRTIEWLTTVGDAQPLPRRRIASAPPALYLVIGRPPSSSTPNAPLAWSTLILRFDRQR